MKKILGVNILCFFLSSSAAFAFNFYSAVVDYDNNQFLYLQPINDPQRITYRIDPGTLGALNNEQVIKMIQWASRQWETVADVHFEYLGLMNEDVTQANYLKYFPEDCSTLEEDPYPDTTLLILLDDKDIFIKTFGSQDSAGLEKKSCFSKPQIVLSSMEETTTSANDPLKLKWYSNVAIHEIGHALGIGHANNLNFNDSSFVEQGPIMLPFSSQRTNLHLEDINAIQWLYPKTSSNPVGIKGKIFMHSSKKDAFFFVNVNLIEKNNPICGTFETTAFVKCDEQLCQGAYLFPSIPAGDYLMYVDGLRGSAFTGNMPVEFFNYHDEEFEDQYKADLIQFDGKSMEIDLNFFLAPEGTDGDKIIDLFYYPIKLVQDIWKHDKPIFCYDNTNKIYEDILGMHIDAPDKNTVATSDSSPSSSSTSNATSDMPGGCSLNSNSKKNPLFSVLFFVLLFLLRLRRKEKDISNYHF